MDYLYQGNDKKFNVTISDANGSAVDLTNSTGSYQISRKGDNTALLTGSFDDGVMSIETAASGTLDIDLTDEQTDDLDPGTYVHELKLELDNGKKYTAFFRNLTVRDSLFV